MEKGIIPSPVAFGRIKKATKHFEQHYVNPGKRGVKVVRSRGGCKPRNEKWALYVAGPPTGGTFDLLVTVNGVTEAVSIAYDDTATLVRTALEGHSEIASGDVTVTGGQLPLVSIQIEFTGDLAGKLVPPAIVDYTSLSGSGFGVTLARLERGLPGDASEAP